MSNYVITKIEGVSSEEAAKLLEDTEDMKHLSNLLSRKWTTVTITIDKEK